MIFRFPNPLTEVNVWAKREALEASAHHLLINPAQFKVPLDPSRDFAVEESPLRLAKIGLSQPAGRVRVLHDLASIELQAMELGVRTLIEFPEAPLHFREQLLAITLEESRHLKLCLEALDKLGSHFGEFPIHLQLWRSVRSHDSLLDRILIVHRYLEGSGLDASELLLRRLSGVSDHVVKSVVRVIALEEVSHVEFGSRWYKTLALKDGLEPSSDFSTRLNSLITRIPKRLVPLNRELRLSAGFSAAEISSLEQVQEHFRANLEPLPQ